MFEMWKLCRYYTIGSQNIDTMIPQVYFKYSSFTNADVYRRRTCNLIFNLVEHVPLKNKFLGFSSFGTNVR